MSSAARAEAADSVSLLLQDAELSLTLNDVEQLSQLVANIIDFVTKSDRKCLKKPFEILVKAAGKIDLEKFSAIGNSFAIIFGELLEHKTLDAGGWQTVRTNLEMLAAGKYVREFELIDDLEEQDRRKRQIAEDIRRKETENQQPEGCPDEMQKDFKRNDSVIEKLKEQHFSSCSTSSPPSENQRQIIAQNRAAALARRQAKHGAPMIRG